MSNITRQFNLDLNVYKLPNPNQVVLDSDTGERLQFYRANSLEFSITFGDGSGDFDMSSVGKVSLEVKQPSCSISPPKPLAPLQMYKEVEGSFATGAPVVISFDADETAIRDGVNWMSITLYSASGERMTTVSGTVFVLGNGYGAANVPDVQDLRDQAVQAAIDSCACADRSEAAAISAESDADRAQGIADNLQAVAEALSYRGTWSSGVAPSGAQRGYFWVIASPATWGSITWAVGDAALYNGSTWQRVAIDWLLAQANANIDALRREVDLRKQPVGGVYMDAGALRATVPLAPVDLSPLTGFAFELLFEVDEVSTHGGAVANRWYCIFGTLQGVATFHAGGVGIGYNWRDNTVVFANEDTGGSATGATVDYGAPIVGKIIHAIGSYDPATGNLRIALSTGAVGEVAAPDLTITSTREFKLMTCTQGNGGINSDRTTGGAVYKAAIYNRPLTEIEEELLFRAGGQIVPLSARAALLVDLAMDDGTGYQLRDRSGNGNHGLLTETGCEHLIPKDGATVEAAGVDASSATYLLRSGPVLPSSAIVTGVIVDGEYLPATGAQSSTQTRIRLNPTGGNLEVQRSDGTAHQTLCTFTPASLASVDVKVIYQSAS